MKNNKKIKEKILKALKSEQEIVINRCWGGFGLSVKAIKRYAELSGFKIYVYKKKDNKREEHIRVDTKEEEEGTLRIFYYLKKDFGKEIGKLPNDDNLWFSERDIKRDDEILVQVVKELGKKANGEYAELRIVKIPSNIDWDIDDYDGMEKVEEKHRVWN